MSANQRDARTARLRIVIVGIVLGLALGTLIALGFAYMSRDGANSSSPAPNETIQTTSPTPTPTPTGGSVCGLEGKVLENTRLTTPPKVDKWDKYYTTFYPTSAKYGPGKSVPDDYNYCFQRSPEGAVFAAANSMAKLLSDSNLKKWEEYFFSKGRYRNQLIKEIHMSDGSNESYEFIITGFDVSSYDGTKAIVNFRVTIHSNYEGDSVSIYSQHLIWEEGDWKLDTDNKDCLDRSEEFDSPQDIIAWGP